MNALLAVRGAGRFGGAVASGTVQGWGERGANARGIPPGAYGFRGGPGGMPGGGPGAGHPGAYGYGRGFGMGVERGPADVLVHLVGAFIMIAVIALLVVAFWKLFQRAGFAGPWGLLAIVPVVNVAALVWLAFAEWPVLNQAAPTAAEPSVVQDPSPPVAAAQPIAGTTPESESPGDPEPPA